MDKQWQDIQYINSQNNITYWGVRMVRVERIIFAKEIIQINYVDSNHIYYMVELPILASHKLIID